MSESSQVRKGVSVKHDIIEKANSNTVLVVAGAVFVVVFCIFAIRTLVSQMSFQNTVISEKKKALTQLEKNNNNLNSLSEDYATFDESVINILGGARDGEGPRDGSNTKIVLDALPASLDIPALASSFEKILVEGGYQFDSISGSERSTTASKSNVVANEQLYEIDYGFSVQGSTEQTLTLLERLESSIRPIYVDQVNMSVNKGNINASYSIRTFYAEEMMFELGSKEVK